MDKTVKTADIFGHQLKADMFVIGHLDWDYMVFPGNMPFLIAQNALKCLDQLAMTSVY